MGLDLSLLPFDGEDFSHTILNCEQDYGLFEAIEALEKEHYEGFVPKNFNSYLSRIQSGKFAGEQCYGETLEDAYGSRMKTVRAGDLAKVRGYKKSFTGRNRAIWAYLAALDPNTKVALYWR